MIINALYRHYETLLNDKDAGVSPPGFSKGKVGYCLVLSREGQLLEVLDLRVSRNNKLVSREINVPEQIKRTVAINANFMCDNCSYILGLGQKNKKEKNDRNKGCFEDFVCLHKTILENAEDEGASALLAFLHGWDIDAGGTNPVIARYLDDLIEGTNLIFKLEGSEGYLHERRAIKEAWHKYRESRVSEVRGQCPVSYTHLDVYKRQTPFAQ